jgi:hypothetical protein
MAKGAAKARTLDFSNVKDRGSINPTHKPEGDYLAKVMSVDDITMGAESRPAWLYVVKVGSGSYPYRCGFNDNELWKIRNLHVAAGLPVPKARQAIDPNKPVGRDVGVTLQDHTYEGKLTSEIAAVFPATELEADDGVELDEDEVPVDEEEEEAPQTKRASATDVEAPDANSDKKKKKKKKAKMESLDIDDL